MDWSQFRQRPPDEDRSNTQWPWYPQSQTPLPTNQSMTDEGLLNTLRNIITPQDIPPVTRLGRDLGARDVEKPSDEELLQFLLKLDYMNTPEGMKEYEDENGPWLPRDARMPRMNMTGE